MNKVHIFISTGRFKSFAEMREFIDETYPEDEESDDDEDEDGDDDPVPSPFMEEVGLSRYEPGCIEAIYKGEPLPLSTLLAEASYVEQWLAKVEGDRVADSAICVFAPNRVARPSDCSLEYVGAYDYQV
ncbi:immunity 22 family protein [Anatilimnocola floriformis]|uniref:immunity 22 family protein n=1 Tax=Anatilimnocola floriformis TaxID=2948575 RepID=UPI0020C56C52|nr:immunity 22 family protein [Anatilimnocola floriformis]